MQAKGMKSILNLAFESTYGVLPSTGTIYRMPFNKNALTSKQNQIESNTITGRRDAVQPGLGQIDVSGQIDLPLDVRNIGLALKAIIGVPTTTSLSTSGNLISNSPIDVTLEDWIKITTGSFHISIDGTASDVTGITFASVSSMAAIATAIQTAIQAANTKFSAVIVSYDEGTQKITITSGTTGATSSVSQMTAAASGTYLGDLLNMTNGVSTAGAALYQHVFKVGDSIPSLTIEKGFSDISKYFRYLGAKVNKFSLTAQVGNNETTYTMDMMAANEVEAAVPLSAAPSSLALLRFNNVNAEVKEGGNTLAICRKIQLDIDNGLDGDTYCLNGSGIRPAINEGVLTPSGSVEALFIDTSLLDKAINGTETSLELIYSNGPYSLSIKLPELLFERATPTVDGPKGVTATLSYKGYYSNDSGNSAVIATLINDVSSYAG
ncbi:phage tail tube protein [Pectinatus haikarae]|uniref:phage tail tube protein n=1 Tax=Pectinatus haikarae TaxID=349096 RepID=UPI002ED992E3